MGPSAIEKFKNNLVAFLVGAITSGGIVWSVADNLHKKEITILEREQIEIQKRLNEAVTLLATTKASVSDSHDSSSTRKQEIETLIQKLDAEIKAKKVELARHSPMSDDSPKDGSYMRIDDELRSLQQQRDEARQRLIQVL